MRARCARGQCRSVCAVSRVCERGACGAIKIEIDAWKDEEEAEEEQKARWPYYKPDWQVQHDRRRLDVVPLHC